MSTSPRPPAVPSVDGVVSSDELITTAHTIAALQLPAVVASPDVVMLVDAKGQRLRSLSGTLGRNY